MREDRYPVVPRPLTVDCKEADEIYPNVASPTVVDVRFVPVMAAPELTYPADPNPATVDIKDDSNTDVLMIFEKETPFKLDTENCCVLINVANNKTTRY